MSLIFMFFYLAVLPVAVITGTWWLFLKSKNKLLKIGSVTIGLVVLGWYLWVAVGELWVVDNKVLELCEKNGGVKVYKKVKLDRDLIDKNGRINIPDKKNAQIGSKYYYEYSQSYIKHDNPKITRFNYRVIRSSDEKILGESISYSRSGGGLPGPWHGSKFTCPDPKGMPGVEEMVFMTGSSNE